jgi:hypothetical protein
MEDWYENLITASDQAEECDRHDYEPWPRCSASCAASYPFRSGRMDAVLSLFSINHAADPGRLVRERCGSCARGDGW